MNKIKKKVNLDTLWEEFRKEYLEKRALAGNESSDFGSVYSSRPDEKGISHLVVVIDDFKDIDEFYGDYVTVVPISTDVEMATDEDLIIKKYRSDSPFLFDFAVRAGIQMTLKQTDLRKYVTTLSEEQKDMLKKLLRFVAGAYDVDIEGLSMGRPIVTKWDYRIVFEKELIKSFQYLSLPAFHSISKSLDRGFFPERNLLQHIDDLGKEIPPGISRSFHEINKNFEEVWSYKTKIDFFYGDSGTLLEEFLMVLFENAKQDPATGKIQIKGYRFQGCDFDMVEYDPRDGDLKVFELKWGIKGKPSEKGLNQFYESIYYLFGPTKFRYNVRNKIRGGAKVMQLREMIKHWTSEGEVGYKHPFQFQGIWLYSYIWKEEWRIRSCLNQITRLGTDSADSRIESLLRGRLAQKKKDNQGALEHYMRADTSRFMREEGIVDPVPACYVKLGNENQAKSIARKNIELLHKILEHAKRRHHKDSYRKEAEQVEFLIRS